ncbi:sugar transporter ERD6-like 8 [Malania oleifera]|uniref:sugar transporter ERD6-like 8 n=1 Tax=Malania oleifera TaxID=397392 RepID=UPI0025ADC1A8|nr:sugar transporter ERD6-like 8 [Malania oleifera]
MARNQDLEIGNGSLCEPLITQKTEEEEIVLQHSNNGGLWMLLFSTFVAVCGSFEYGSCVGYTAPTQFGIMDDLKLSYSQYSFFGSVLTIGGMIGAIMSGWIADSVGRKGAMRIASVSCIGGWLAVYLSVESILLDLGRLLTGYGVGLLSYVVPVYIAEISPRELRGALATTNQIFISIAMLIAFVIGAFVKWRTLAITGIIPCMILLAGLYFIPESPRWLAMIGRQKEFQVALRKLRGANADISEEEAELTEYVVANELLPKVTVLDLLDRRNVRALAVGAGLMVFQQFVGYNAIVFYAGHVFVSAGVPPNVGSILYASLQVVVTALGASLIDRTGRRPLLLLSASGLLLGSLLTGISFLLKAHQLEPELVPVLAVAGIMIYMGFFSIGMCSIPWVMMSEIFPINTKGIAGSLVTLVNWFGSWIVSYTFNFLMSWSPHGIFFVFAAVCVMAIIFVIRVVPETKGRTLEEIQASMS